MEIKKLAKVMKALSNPNRLELYLEIVKKNEASFKTGGETFVNEIIDCLNIGAPTISHHLKELSNAGLITTDRRGKYLIAKVNNEIIEEVGSILRLRNDKS